MLTWTCHICKVERPDHLIGVHTIDSSEKYNLPPGTMKQNIRYCTDNPDCAKKVKNFSFF
jgi:hypothetical protein